MIPAWVVLAGIWYICSVQSSVMREALTPKLWPEESCCDCSSTSPHERRPSRESRFYSECGGKVSSRRLTGMFTVPGTAAVMGGLCEWKLPAAEEWMNWTGDLIQPHPVMNGGDVPLLPALSLWTLWCQPGLQFFISYFHHCTTCIFFL